MPPVNGFSAEANVCTFDEPITSTDSTSTTDSYATASFSDKGPASQTCRFDHSDDSSSRSALASSASLAATFARVVAPSAPATAAASVQATNSIDDLLTFMHAQAGFEAGAAMPPTFNSRSASPFGTAAHARATDVLNDMQGAGFLEADRIYSEVRAVNGVVTQIGGTPGGPAGAHNMDVVVARPGTSIAVGDNISGGTAEMIGDLKYGGGVINTKYAVHGSPLATLNGRTTAGSVPDTPPVFPEAEMTAGTRWLGAGMGALNVAGGFMMLADLDTKRDPAILTAGKIGSGGASIVGGGMEIGGAALGVAGIAEVGAALSGVGALIAAPIAVHELGRPRGIIAYDPQLVDQAIKEGHNLFCAQCHGRGGALDPNSDWNSGDSARREAFLRRLQFVDLGR